MNKLYVKVRKLIHETESLPMSEKIEWYGLIPTMNYKQIKRLIQILEDEERKLKELRELDNFLNSTEE